MTRTVSRAGVLVLLAAAFAPAAGATPLRVAPPNGDIGGAVADSTNGTPFPGGEGRAMRAGATVALTPTHGFGRHVMHHLPAAPRNGGVPYLGLRAATRQVTVA